MKYAVTPVFSLVDIGFKSTTATHYIASIDFQRRCVAFSVHSSLEADATVRFTERWRILEIDEIMRFQRL